MVGLRLRVVCVVVQIILLINRVNGSFDMNLMMLGGEEAMSDTAIPKRVCQIAEDNGAQVNYVYANHRSITSMHQLELNLYKCLAGKLPMQTLDFEAHPTEDERKFSTLSVILIPEGKEAAAQRIHQIIKLIRHDQTNKNMHRYVFVWRGVLLQNLHEFFQQIWSKRIVHAIALTESGKVFTFEPFGPQGFRVVTIEGDQYFPDKLRNLHHQMLRISMFEDKIRAIPKHNYETEGYTAVDGLIASTIVEAMNATALYVLPTDNKYGAYGACERGNFTGSQGDVIAGLTDVAFNGRFVLACAKDHVEQLYPYRNRCMYLVVPAAQMRDEYLIFVNAFTNNLWRFLLVVFVLACGVFYALQWCSRRIPKFHRSPQFRWYEIIEFVWESQLGEPIEGFSRISSMRLFLITWILFSYVVTTVYFAKLESSFVHPTFEPELDSLDELHKLQTPIYSVRNSFDAIEVTLEPKHWQAIQAKAIIVPGSYSGELFFLPIIQQSKDVSFILRGSSARILLIQSHDNEYGRPSFHVMRQHLRALPLTYIVTRGSPYKHKFNYYMTIFYEHGLLKHWMHMDVVNLTKNAHNGAEHFNTLAGHFEATKSRRIKSATQTKRVVLSLDILQGAFYIFGFGILVSVMGFGAEYAYYTYMQRVLLRKFQQP